MEKVLGEVNHHPPSLPCPRPAKNPVFKSQSICQSSKSDKRVWKNQNKSIPNGERRASNVVRKHNEIRLNFCRWNPAPFKLVSTPSGRLKSLSPFLKYLLASSCTINHRIACFHAHKLSQSWSVAKSRIGSNRSNLLGWAIGFKAYISTLHWYQSLSRVCLVVMNLPLDSTVCGYANLFQLSCFFPTLLSVDISMRFQSELTEHMKNLSESEVRAKKETWGTVSRFGCVWGVWVD